MTPIPLRRPTAMRVDAAACVRCELCDALLPGVLLGPERIPVSPTALEAMAACRYAAPPSVQPSTSAVRASMLRSVSSAVACTPAGDPKTRCASCTGYTPRSRSAPPPRAGSKSRCVARAAAGTEIEKSASTTRGRPIAPSSSSSASRT